MLPATRRTGSVQRALEGDAVADEATQAIQQGPEEINEINVTVDELAFQTAKSVHHTGIGAAMVRATRDMLGRIKSGDASPHGAMQGPDDARRNQVSRFQALAGTVGEMDQNTRRNAGLAQQSATAASAVKGYSGDLPDQMTRLCQHLGAAPPARWAAEWAAEWVNARSLTFTGRAAWLMREPC